MQLAFKRTQQYNSASLGNRRPDPVFKDIRVCISTAIPNSEIKENMSYNKIPAGNDLPNDINVVIEIPANHDPIKYEIDKDSDAIFVDRFVATPMFYPANYGYIPQTLSEDGDPLDVLVVTPYPVMPGAVIRSRAVGVLNMSDESGVDALPYLTLNCPNCTITFRKLATCQNFCLIKSSTTLKTTKHWKLASG